MSLTSAWMSRHRRPHRSSLCGKNKKREMEWEAFCSHFGKPPGNVNTSCALGRLSKLAKRTGLGYGRRLKRMSMSSRTMKEPPHSSSAIFALPGPMSFGILHTHRSSTGNRQGKAAARRGARRRAGHGTDHGCDGDGD